MSDYNFVTDRLAIGDVASRATPGFVGVVSLLATELRNVDLMPDAAREKAAARLQERLNSNLHMAEVEGMRVQIQLQPARARLVKVEL